MIQVDQGSTNVFQEISSLLPKKISKTGKSVKQAKNRRYKNVGWVLFNNPFESGKQRETKVNSGY